MQPHSPPVPLAAFYHLAADVLEVQFDRNLIRGPTAKANWTGDILYDAPPITRKSLDPVVPGTILGKTVTVPMKQVGVGGVDNTCNYAATPADVISTYGIPAAAFVGFPLAVV